MTQYLKIRQEFTFISLINKRAPTPLCGIKSFYNSIVLAVYRAVLCLKYLDMKTCGEADVGYKKDLYKYACLNGDAKNIKAKP
jgi:hypothetical protein